MNVTKLKIILFFIIIVLPLGNLHSQQRIKFKHLNVKDGLSQSWVKCILQDHNGLLWFATGGGINKYNGCDFTLYRHEQHDINSLSNNVVNAIYEDSSGKLWIGTQRGINIYDRETDKFIRYPELEQEYINAFFEIDESRIIVAHNSGLHLIKQKSCTDNDDVDQFIRQYPYTSVNAVQIDRDGNVWLATYLGLYLLDLKKRKYTVFKLDKNNPESMALNGIKSIYIDSMGRLWLGTASIGLILVKFKNDDPYKPEFLHYSHDPTIPHSISKGAVLALLDDRDGNLWIGIENGGISRLNLQHFNEKNPHFTHYLHNPADNFSISNNSIYSLYRDNEGTVWVGTYGDGVNYYNKLLSKFSHYYHIPNDPNSLIDNTVNTIFEDDEYLWIGTEGGLNILNKKTGIYEHYLYDPQDPHSIGSNSVLAICRDSTGTMWIGTWAGGLNVFDKQTKSFIRYYHDEKDDRSLGSNNIFSLLCDSNGNLWIATMGGGLNLFNRQTHSFKRFTTDFRTPNTISDNWVRSLLQAEDGNLWISTTTAVDRYNIQRNEFTTFKHDKTNATSISYNGAITLFKDSKHNIWFGTESGLNVYHPDEDYFSCYLEDDGLPNNTILAICEDNHENLWISTNNGISKFVNGVNEPEIQVFVNYTEDDGLQGNEFCRRSVFKASDGRIYFGGNNGFNVFHPDSIKENTLIPNVIITNFLIFNKPVEIGAPGSPLPKHISLLDEVTLKHTQSVFSIEYAILNYLAPNKNQYAFILEGFEKEWNFVGNQRLATYTNLDPGKYIFRVKGANNDGIWSEKGTSLSIIIVAPWWKTMWAYACYFILSMFLIFGLWKFQMNKAAIKHELFMEQQYAENLEKINLLKSRFFSNITHEFRTPLTLIMGPVKQFLADERIDNFKEKCEMVLRNSEKLYQLINQLLDLSKIEAGHVSLCAQKENIMPLVEKLVMAFSPLVDRKRIDLNMNVVTDSYASIDSFELYIDRDKLEKIISNLVSNAIKFTPENGRIDVTLKTFRAGEYEIIDDDELDESQNIKRSTAIGNSEVLRKASGFVEIAVRDTGVGILEADLQKIFDRFYQVTNSSLDSHESTGIGLALTKELVELHYGTIHVVTEYGYGSMFVVRLPMGKDHLKDNEIVETSEQSKTEQKYRTITEFTTKRSVIEFENDELDSSNGNPLVLVVDDNVDILKYLYETLKHDYHIITASDGQKGFEKAMQRIPDLIVSDIMMPKFGGISFCKKIKTEEVTSHIPVILLTARASNKSKIDGLEAGADAYVTKPFEADELKVRIRNLIEQRKKLIKKFNRKGGLKPVEIATNTYDEKFLEKALALVETHMSEPEYGVEEFAKEMSLSRAQLYRKIRALTGQTATEFIRTVRLNRAAQLIKQGHRNISQIAYDVGFQTPSYFSKSFLKLFGTYPSHYADSDSKSENA
ncbi:response regulator [candidate division KSB1 bacterium]|nr:response regulator [candidate division KSB1 bacterium]